MRNRPSKIFKQQRLLLNGMTFYRDSAMDSLEEYTHRYWDRGAYQLENTGLPLSRPVQFHYKSDTTRPTVDLDSACEPVVQAAVTTAERTDNANFQQRVKDFAANWDQSTSTWRGEVTIPVQVGPFQPYASKKSGERPNKYIPYIEQLELECVFDQGEATGDRPTVNAGQFGVAQNLFEATGATAEACRMYTNAPPDQTLTPYSVVINDHYCWLNVLLDTFRY